MKHLSVANRANADLIDENYAIWLSNPGELTEDWRAFFEGFELGLTSEAGGSQTSGSASNMPPAPSSAGSVNLDLQSKVIGALFAYRNIGHTQAHFNPLLKHDPFNPRLSLSNMGLSSADLEKTCHTGNYLGGKTMKVGDLLDDLRQTYCGTVAVEYLHLQNTAERRWLQKQMEPCRNTPSFSKEKKLSILEKVLEAELFESFLHTRYVGQKRFGVDGGETTIAALNAILEASPESGIKSIVLGMAHRGRLNVLANILGKAYPDIFREFDPGYLPANSSEGSGDVKYHQGFENTRTTSSGAEVALRLAANPSHLEAVNPVVEGIARAYQRRLEDTKERKAVLPLLLHGDAAIAGQGITAEVFNLSQLTGYKTGGTVHFVINNQIGFTTNPEDSRSGLYCTDIAKSIEVPIFHVNGDDPEAVVYVTELALAYRQAFGKDVVVDMYCYRKHGHNESDEPAYTQPTLYKNLKTHPSISTQYVKKLEGEGVLSAKDAAALKTRFEDKLKAAAEEDQETDRSRRVSQVPFLKSPLEAREPAVPEAVETGATKQHIAAVAKAMATFPEGFDINSKIKRQVSAKAKVFEKGENLDWAFCETLAFGTLLLEGIPVRLSGQDSERGTFSQRHLCWYDSATRKQYVPLKNIEAITGKAAETFCVYNSSLSEAGVLGFDYGYTMGYPEMLCMWEAQFGDFANGAQVIIDQFIASSFSKWGSESALVMLLPHGYEGQGPEHSSARLERFLQLCAEGNMRVCNVSTPAQYFHVLRRQKKLQVDRPLIIFTPKSLLRHKGCVSSVDDLVKAKFEPVLDDPLFAAGGPKTKVAAKVKRVVLCSGKVYYDLLAQREEAMKDTPANAPTTAIVRVEELYPYHGESIKKICAHYGTKGTPAQIVWCQEEPKNMGAYSFIAPHLSETFAAPIEYAGRPPAASPAVGSAGRHKLEQAALVKKALGL